MADNRNDRPKTKKVISGNARMKNSTSIKSVFISNDAGKVKDHAFFDILVPAIKNMLCDIIVDGIQLVLYGDTSSRRRDSGKDRNYVSYNKYSERRDRDRDRDYYDSRDRRNYNDLYRYSNIELESRKDAEDLILEMEDAIAQYGSISVAEVCEMAGIKSDYPDFDYGWTSIRTAKIREYRDYFIVQLPKVVSIK